MAGPSDSFKNFSDTVIAPARRVFAVAASPDPIKDDQDQPVVLKGLRAAGAGTVTIMTTDSPKPCVHPVLDGERIDARITHVTAMTGVTGLIGYA